MTLNKVYQINLLVSAPFYFELSYFSGKELVFVRVKKFEYSALKVLDVFCGFCSYKPQKILAF